MNNTPILRYRLWCGIESGDPLVYLQFQSIHPNLRGIGDISKPPAADRMHVCSKDAPFLTLGKIMLPGSDVSADDRVLSIETSDPARLMRMIRNALDELKHNKTVIATCQRPPRSGDLSVVPLREVWL